MGITLRVLLLVASVLTSIWILYKIRKNGVKQEDALFWIVFAVMLALLGIFPQISYVMCSYLGVQSPANFVFLVIIALLLEKIFTLSIKTSLLENKIEIMAAELAIRCKDMEDSIGYSKEEK